MTVKELKEKLELLIEDNKEDYLVYVDEFFNEPIISYNDEDMEVYL